VAEDLGTWPPEQATVLLEVLQQAGLSPEARRTRDGVVVTVPEAESDEAHRQLVSNMDAIARAAKRPPATGSRRKPRAVLGADSSRDRDQRLGSERMLRLARPLGLLLIGLLLATVIRGPLTLPIIVFSVAGAIYLIGKQTQDGDGP
jgi:hypothetical protein